MRKLRPRKGSVPGHRGHPGLEPRTHGSGSQYIRQTGRELRKEGRAEGSLCLEAAAAVDRSPSAAQIGHLIFLIQEIQRVVTREASDGELVGHLGPVLTVGGHTLIQLCCLGEQVL